MGRKRKNEEKRTAVHPNTYGLVHLRLVFACLFMAGMSGSTKSYGVRVAIDQRRGADIVLAGKRKGFSVFPLSCPKKEGI